MIIASVCCRAGSVRVPNKATRVFSKGMSLLELTIEQAQRVFAQVVVSTDSNDAAQIARHWGCDVIDRPAHLATSEASKWDVFRHLVDRFPCETLVDLDIGCPLRADKDIYACLTKLPEYEVVCTAYESERNPYFNMVDSEGQVIIPRGIVNGQAAPKVYSLSPAVYAIKTTALFEHEHWSACHLGIHIIPRERAWDIDTEFDFRVGRLLKDA